ncbi:hypothetical protein [Sphingomonas jatrophae]|uniref:Uncharacterized protein n=1 Tax=Sphingomonas jatrophae TaxID=1166337 RepID=A0A1I6KEE8_9SPHN|nr:hypothetical protein [Sphingomonas jatrophae]SFR89645.1 hypothetical protein SAMN05192580_1644 [Sphingomonas jatrophae]
MAGEQVVRVWWRVPEDMIAFFHGGAVSMAMVPPGIQSLAGTDIANQLVMTVKVRDEAGAIIGLMTEMEIFPEGDAFEVYTMLVLNGRGTIVTRQTKNRTTLMKPFAKVIESGEDWSGEMDVAMTEGPIDGGWGAIVAGTDEFAGAGGRHRQRMTFRAITAAGSEGTALEEFVLTAGGQG